MQDTYTITMEKLKKHMENEKARKDYPVIVIINGEYYDLLPDETTNTNKQTKQAYTGKYERKGR